MHGLDLSAAGAGDWMGEIGGPAPTPREGAAVHPGGVTAIDVRGHVVHITLCPARGFFTRIGILRARLRAVAPEA